MKLTKCNVWIGGILVTASVVAMVLLSGVNDHLTVHLVDVNKKPVSASVMVQEVRSYPMLGSMKFLPLWARRSTRTISLDLIDGTVKVRRINAPGKDAFLIIRAKLKPNVKPSEFVVFIIGETNGANVYRFQQKVGRITREQTETFVTLEEGIDVNVGTKIHL